MFRRRNAPSPVTGRILQQGDSLIISAVTVSAHAGRCCLVRVSWVNLWKSRKMRWDSRPQNGGSETPYSFRNAVDGLTFVARHAGR